MFTTKFGTFNNLGFIYFVIDLLNESDVEDTDEEEIDKTLKNLQLNESKKENDSNQEIEGSKDEKTTEEEAAEK